MLETTSFVLPEGGSESFGDFSLCDWKTISPGTAYSETTSTDTANAVKKRQGKASPDYPTAAGELDGMFGTPAGSIGPVESELSPFHPRKVAGQVVGEYGEMTRAVQDIASLIGFELAAKKLQSYDTFLQQIRRGLGLALHHGWAELMLGRWRDLVQHPNQPRPTATDVTDADDEEAY